MAHFLSVFETYNWNEIKSSIYAKTSADVERALTKSSCDLEDFKALISPAAAPYLEIMAQKSHHLTLQRFGRTIQMYLPLYLSNVCHNICTYCGFSLDNKMPRRILNPQEVAQEVEVIKAMGYSHILLVTGEANKQVGTAYFEKIIKQIAPQFSNISMEVQPLSQPDYETLIKAGLHAVLVYQETYNHERYNIYHPKGRKSNFEFRLDTPDRLGKSGVHKIGIGALLGLEDWRTDSFFTALHLDYLERTYWQTRYAISFPRLRPHAGSFMPKSIINDRELTQLICAYRLFNQEVELSLSTRENQTFRNHIIKLGITSTSAGSKTNPGGYSVAPEALEQFAIDDNRNPQEMAAAIKAQGYEPVWKNWDNSLQ